MKFPIRAIGAPVLICATVLTVIAVTVGLVFYPHSPSQPHCGTVPRKYFSDDELQWLDRASDAHPTAYRACILSPAGDSSIDAPAGTAVVRLPDITTAELRARTAWRSAADDCPLGRQDVLRAFGTDLAGQWRVLTWNGEPAVCAGKQNQLPQEVLVRGKTVYDLFTDNNDALGFYLE